MAMPYMAMPYMAMPYMAMPYGYVLCIIESFACGTKSLMRGQPRKPGSFSRAEVKDPGLRG
jgi:hypothetical protein